MFKKSQKMFGELAVEKRFVTQSQLDEALQKQKESFEGQFFNFEGATTTTSTTKRQYKSH